MAGRLSSFFSDQVAASWTPDLWGKIRRMVEANVAIAQASAADLADARLSAQGTLAGDYLQLRIADELKRLLDQSATAYAESLRITQNQYRSGTADQSAVSQAQAQLQSTQAQAIATGVTRAQFEHAIAVLIGVPPAELTIAPSDQFIQIPDIPPGLPSALLERRPDVAAAERTMASANAEIGVGVAAFYPTITLTADAGTAAATFEQLVGKTGEFWSFGGSLAETVFEGGLRNAEVQAAVAVFDEDLADYRQTVLTAFQQVEDQLAALRIFADEATVQDSAVARGARGGASAQQPVPGGHRRLHQRHRCRADRTRRRGNGADDPRRPARRQRQPDPGAGWGLERIAIAGPRPDRRSGTAQLQPAAADLAGAGPKPLTAPRPSRPTRRVARAVISRRVLRSDSFVTLGCPPVSRACVLPARCAYRSMEPGLNPRNPGVRGYAAIGRRITLDEGQRPRFC